MADKIDNKITYQRERYPDMNRKGWAFITNASIENIPIEQGSLEEYEKSLLLFKDDLRGDRVYIAYDREAYWLNGTVDKGMVPIFVRVLDPTKLGEIGFVKRDPDFDAQFRPYKIVKKKGKICLAMDSTLVLYEKEQVRRFELMDFED